MDCIHETVKIILEDNSLQQFDDTLYGLNERRPLDNHGNLIPSDSSDSEAKESEEKEEVDENGDQFQKCPVCNTDCRSPNNQMTNEIKKVKEIMRKTTTETKHFPKSDYVTSHDILDHTKQFIFCWEPHKLLHSVNMTVSDLNCWNIGCSGKISVLPTLEHRCVEGLKANGFIVYCVYACSKCKTNKQKSSLEIPSLHKMGFPLFVTRQSPVIPMHKSAVCFAP